MKYRVINISGSDFLKKYLNYAYELSAGKASSMYTTIPNGTIGISIVTQGSSSIYSGNEWRNVSGCVVYGLTTKTEEVCIYPGFREITFGVSPQFLQLFLQESMSHLSRGKITALEHLLCKYDVEQLQTEVLSATSDQAILDAIERFLRRRLGQGTVDARVQTALYAITTEKILSVEKIADSLDVSAATLRNLFQEYIGISPKEMMRISRIKDALNYEVTSEDKLTSIAYSLGYFDQAHFIHDFKSVLGITPAQYFKNKQLIFDFYNSGRWSESSFAA